MEGATVTWAAVSSGGYLVPFYNFNVTLEIGKNLLDLASWVTIVTISTAILLAVLYLIRK